MQEMREMTNIEKIRKEFKEYEDQTKLDFGNFYFCNPSHQLVFTDSFSGKKYRQNSMKYTINAAADEILKRIEADYAAKETKLQTPSERFIDEVIVKCCYKHFTCGISVKMKEEREAKEAARKEAEAKYEEIKKDVDVFLKNVHTIPAGDFNVTYNNIDFIKDDESVCIEWNYGEFYYETETFTNMEMWWYCDMLLGKARDELGLAS